MLLIEIYTGEKVLYVKFLLKIKLTYSKFTKIDASNYR